MSNRGKHCTSSQSISNFTLFLFDICVFIWVYENLWIQRIFFRVFFSHIYIYYDAFFRFVHVMCLLIYLNILKYLNLVTDFIFGKENNVGAFWRTYYYFCTLFWPIFDRTFYISRDHAPVSSHIILNIWMRSTP